jgi:hypothetical protein
VIVTEVRPVAAPFAGRDADTTGASKENLSIDVPLDRLIVTATSAWCVFAALKSLRQLTVVALDHVVVLHASDATCIDGVDVL